MVSVRALALAACITGTARSRPGGCGSAAAAGKPSMLNPLHPLEPTTLIRPRLRLQFFAQVLCRSSVLRQTAGRRPWKTSCSSFLRCVRLSRFPAGPARAVPRHAACVRAPSSAVRPSSRTRPECRFAPYPAAPPSPRVFQHRESIRWVSPQETGERVLEK
jgi:hypothetical protein